MGCPPDRLPALRSLRAYAGPADASKRSVSRASGGVLGGERVRVSEGENGGGRMRERERIRQRRGDREGECEVCAMHIHRCDKLNAWYLLSCIQSFSQTI